MSSLVGKVAIITGASRGIGKSIALRFAEEGADLLLIATQADKLNSVAEQASEFGSHVEARVVDVTDEENVNIVIKEAINIFGHIDILVNNAGIYVKTPENLIDPEGDEEFTNVKIEYCRKVLEVNVIGTYNFIRAVLPEMIEQRKGKIINLGSVAGVNGIPGMAEYSASKGAIIAFTKALAHEVARYQINVNCISPGSILIENGSTPMTYLGRYGQPKDIAGVAAFLASEDSDFLVGQNIIVDGGRTLSLNCEE